MSIGDEVLNPGRDIPAPGDNALMFYARQAGRHRDIFNLVAAGHDLHARDELERTPLILATVSADVRNVLTLLRQGADINDRDTGNDTALHWAVHHGNAAVARLLLKKGADMELENGRGQSALQLAVDKDNAGVLQAFIDAKTKKLTTPFTQGTAERVTVRAPLTFRPQIKLKSKIRKPL